MESDPEAFRRSVIRGAHRANESMKNPEPEWLTADYKDFIRHLEELEATQAAHSENTTNSSNPSQTDDLDSQPQ